MNYTSIKQSKKLLEFGLSPETADCFYTEFGDILVSKPYEDGMEPAVPYIPCWSVGALLALIPKHPKFNNALRIVEGNKIIWTFICHAISEYEFKRSSDLECLYNAVVWLLENNYIEKGE